MFTQSAVCELIEAPRQNQQGNLSETNRLRAAKPICSQRFRLAYMHFKNQHQ